jgi:hypothetical protein
LANALLNPFPCADPITLFHPVRWLTLYSVGALVLVSVAASACRTSRQVAVRVSIPGADTRETPAAGVGVIALPYDRDSVLSSLAARARTPRPATSELDTLFARFRAPFTRYTHVALRATQLRDSLEQLRESAGSSSRAVSADIRRLEDSVRAVDRQLDRARAELDRARADFQNRGESLRTAVRSWEDSTYRGYDSIVERLTKAQGRDAETDTTNQTGWAHLTLSPGRWWIYARAWDTSDPNAEWYWNIPVQDDTVLLSSRTGQRKAKY